MTTLTSQSAAVCNYPVPNREDDGEMIQLLTPEGRRADDPYFAYEGSDDDVADLLRDMILARLIDTEATALQRKGELALWPPALGQEAAQVGSARATRRPDIVVPGYREHAVTWCLGLDPVQLMTTFRGTHMVPWKSAELGLHPYSFVVGTQSLHATGMAMAMRRDGRVGNADPAKNAAVLVYFGDGAMSQGDVNEAFLFAVSDNAPVVFVCQNNQYAISENVRLQSRVGLYRRADGFGMPGVRVDGNDVLAMHAVTSWAMERARQGHGPALIEAYTYRIGAHTTADDPTKYRSADEVAQWRLKDPIDRVRTYLESRGAIDAAWDAATDAEAEAVALRLRRETGKLTDEGMAVWFDRAYAETPPTVTRQRREYETYLASFAD